VRAAYLHPNPAQATSIRIPRKESAKRSTVSKLLGVCNEAEGDKTPGKAANRPAGLLSDAPGGRLLDVRGCS
jgi:hypothetical protein